ncbi:MAG TPA: Do family serine endopeptidase [Polyangiaceae bacterium]|nr:Do family serine endopeptidase [Polyangiaceae bacterium]
MARRFGHAVCCAGGGTPYNNLGVSESEYTVVGHFNWKVVVLTCLGTSVATAAGVSGCARHTVDPKPESSLESARSGTSNAETLKKMGNDALGLSRVAEMAMPSIVSVASTHVSESHVESPRLPFDDPFFRHFFGPGTPLPMPHGNEAPQTEHGLGSGVLVTGNVILTNAHVVEGAKTLVVTTEDRRNLDVEVAGTDTKSDLAVLRIKSDTKGLKFLDFADSDSAHLGQVVLAIGNPFGVGETVTMGIVSAKGRADLGIADYEDFIQTDAAINPGNSGGALVDLDGRLLGIPTAILSRTGGYMGVGFAIPSNMARPIMQSLLETGHVARSYLGVSIQNIDQDLAKALGLKSTVGVLISDVLPDGPSAKAGLQRGDVVVAINGRAVNSTGELRNSVATAGVGKSVEVEVLRKGETKKIPVTLGAMPADEKSTSATGTSAGRASALGTTVVPLDAKARQQLNVPDSVKAGVVVSEVEPNSKAYDAGIRPGDVIVELGGTRITTPEQLSQEWQKSSGNVAIVLVRGGHTLYVAAKH